MKDGRPFCCGCFESLYAEYCETCGEHIGKFTTLFFAVHYFFTGGLSLPLINHIIFFFTCGIFYITVKFFLNPDS